MSDNIDNFLVKFQDFFAQKITSFSYDNRLQEALLYSTIGGGKRMRPILCYIFGRMASVSINIEHVLYACSAIEAIHCYSLVHDDLPMMDNDDLRRGQPTSHKKYCEATAILVGDALQTIAFELLSDSSFSCSDAIKVNIIHILATASGAKGMVNGQFLDMKLDPDFDDRSLEAILAMHQQKTGRLITASCHIGAVLGGITCPTLLNDIVLVGQLIGQIFQLQDDILDITQSTKTLGKTAGKDINHHKPTIPSLIGLEQAKIYLQKQIDLLNESIDKLSLDKTELEKFLAVLIKRQF